jgi:hypothetical protein
VIGKVISSGPQSGGVVFSIPEIGEKITFYKLFKHESQIKELSQFGDGHSS